MKSFEVVRLIRIPSGTRTVRWSSVAVAICAVLIAADTGAAEDRKLIRVEEDWVGLIRETDEGASSPQIINVISPNSSLSGVYGMIEMNHTTFPSFSEGGIQIQRRKGETLTVAGSFLSSRVLCFDYDRLEYTVGLAIDDNDMTVSVANVKSKTWNDVPSTVMSVVADHNGQSLKDYSPDFSADNSSVHVGAQRVATLCMTQVRYYYSNDDTVVDDTIRIAQRFRGSTEPVTVSDYSSTR